MYHSGSRDGEYFWKVMPPSYLLIYTSPYQSRGVLFTFILSMARNTDVLKKAQEEIDRVVGNERLPDFNDRESLPYVNALLEEVYR